MWCPEGYFAAVDLLQPFYSATEEVFGRATKKPPNWEQETYALACLGQYLERSPSLSASFLKGPTSRISPMLVLVAGVGIGKVDDDYVTFRTGFMFLDDCLVFDAGRARAELREHLDWLAESEENRIKAAADRPLVPRTFGYSGSVVECVAMLEGAAVTCRLEHAPKYEEILKAVERRVAGHHEIDDPPRRGLGRPGKIRHVQIAYGELFPSGHGDLSRKVLASRVEEKIGMRISLDTLDRALKEVSHPQKVPQ